MADTENKKKEDFLKARKDRTSSSVKKKIIKTDLDRLDSKYKRYGAGQMHPENYKDRCEYLYHKGMYTEEMRASRAREAQKIKELEQMKGATFNPSINPKSQEIMENSDIPGLEERTKQYIDQHKHQLNVRDKSGQRVGPLTGYYQREIMCRDSRVDTQPAGRSVSKKKKVVLAPEDWDNFYKKTKEWWKHKENKRELLEGMRKREEELLDAHELNQGRELGISSPAHPLHKVSGGKKSGSKVKSKLDDTKIDTILQRILEKEELYPEAPGLDYSIVKRIDFGPDIEDEPHIPSYARAGQAQDNETQTIQYSTAKLFEHELSLKHRYLVGQMMKDLSEIKKSCRDLDKDALMYDDQQIVLSRNERAHFKQEALQSEPNMFKAYS